MTAHYSLLHITRDSILISRFFLAMGVVIGWVIITGSISACCADKCAYYYNLTFNIILCLAFVAVDLYFAIMEDVTWDIAGGALGGVLFVMAIMIGLVCAMCTDRYDFDFREND